MAGVDTDRLASTRRPASREDELFTNVLVASSRRTRTRREKIGAQASVALHLVAAALIVLVPIFLPSAPAQKDYILALIYNPPPPPPPPPLRGSPLRPERVTPARPKPVVETSQQTTFTAPVETPQPTPDAKARFEEQFGTDDGSDLGDPFGSEGGVEGGVIGGVPGGVLGGVLGGTGSSPVLDYDSPPVRIKVTEPRYPREAFIKKIEGTVWLEIVIDATGRVAHARVTRSVPLLDAAALQCVYGWLFRPATKRGRPVATIANAPVTFTIY